MSTKKTKKIDLEKWTTAENVNPKKKSHRLYRGVVRPARQPAKAAPDRTS